MKRLFVALTTFALLTSGLFYTPLASAHVLKVDNGVSAVLHIDPDDNPSAATPTKLELDFGLQRGGFSLSDCSCGVQVTQAGKTIQRTKVRPAYFGATSQGVATVTFPKIGIYDVLVSGHALNGTLPTFKLDYLERVASGPGSVSNTGAGMQVLAISVASLIVLGVVARTYIRQGERYKRPAKSKK